MPFQFHVILDSPSQQVCVLILSSYNFQCSSVLFYTLDRTFFSLFVIMKHLVYIKLDGLGHDYENSSVYNIVLSPNAAHQPLNTHPLAFLFKQYCTD